MTGPRDSARGNGLAAGAWAILGDVDPRVVPELLASLAEVGIAAFALPSPGIRGGYLDVRLPARPVDQMHVDAERKDEAQAMLLALAHPEDPLAPPGPQQPDPAGPSDEFGHDAAFAAIVARWDDSPAVHAPADRPWPAAEDVVVPDRAEDASPPAPPVRGTAERPRIDPWRGSTASVEPVEEHFEPPEAPPIPRPALLTLVGLCSVLIGIALLVWTAASDTPGPDPQLVGIALLVGGVALLLSRLRNRDDDTDGAVV
jgi:hypothetical protein